MSSLTIRQIPPEVKARLRVRAARHGRSMEDEVRTILREAVREPDAPVDLGEAIRRRFRRFGGVDLEIPSREAMREPVRFR